jgi:hypothetical protein
MVTPCMSAEPEAGPSRSMRTDRSYQSPNNAQTTRSITQGVDRQGSARREHLGTSERRGSTGAGLCFQGRRPSPRVRQKAEEAARNFKLYVQKSMRERPMEALAVSDSC